jgi:hypothetical protein
MDICECGDLGRSGLSWCVGGLRALRFFVLPVLRFGLGYLHSSFDPLGRLGDLHVLQVVLGVRSHLVFISCPSFGETGSSSRSFVICVFIS